MNSILDRLIEWNIMNLYTTKEKIEREWKNHNIPPIFPGISSHWFSATLAMENKRPSPHRFDVSA